MEEEGKEEKGCPHLVEYTLQGVGRYQETLQGVDRFQETLQGVDRFQEKFGGHIPRQGT